MNRRQWHPVFDEPGPRPAVGDQVIFHLRIDKRLRARKARIVALYPHDDANAGEFAQLQVDMTPEDVASGLSPTQLHARRVTGYPQSGEWTWKPQIVS
jgi:hypothetical protein